jgi:hypothetical protein
MEISPKKCKKMVFLGQDPVTRKIFVENKCFATIKEF